MGRSIKCLGVSPEKARKPRISSNATVLREVFGRMPDGIRVLLLEDLVQCVRVEQGGVHALLGRSAHVRTLQDRRLHLGNLVVRKPLVDIAPFGQRRVPSAASRIGT